MLHATLPPAHPWPGMSHPGPDLLLHSQVRNGAPATLHHQALMGQISNPQHSTHSTSHVYTDTMCHQQIPVNSQNFHNFSNYAANVNNHPGLRPVSRQSHDGNIRHASGGSHTSSHRATPPSPDDLRSHTLGYKQNQNLRLERDSRTSFEQIQCNTRDMQGSPGLPGHLHRGGSPRNIHRMPPSPASSIPQKLPFDLTTPMNMVSTPTSMYNHPVRTESVISPTVLMPPISSYQSVSVKQEPGSPAQYASLNPASRAVKQEPNHPHSPQNVNATPPPNHPTHAGYNQMERPVLNSNPSRPSFSYPSPQSSNPISPASVDGARPDGKFRYHSSGKPVQNPSPGESTCNSAISSREGTPGPKLWNGDDMSALAPNVDISRVQVKEEIGHRINYDSNDYNRRPSVNLSYPAATARSMPNDNYSGYSPSYHSLPQQIAIPQRGINTLGQERGYRPSVGRPPIVVPGNSEGAVPHSNVKIGRRPAHLPKVLKFEDHTLPHGWQRKLKQRKHGKQAGRWDVYIYSPCGVKFASRKKLKHFFEKNNLGYDAEQFDFTPYGKHIENAPQRHLSSASSEGARHSGSPGSVHSPSGVYHGSQNLSSEFVAPNAHHPPIAHHSYMPPLPTYEFNPMMESPPNANAREIPHNQILNLSQTPALSSVPRSSAAIVTNFPSEIDDILNENSDAQFRNRLRDYTHDLSSRKQSLYFATSIDGCINASKSITKIPACIKNWKIDKFPQYLLKPFFKHFNNIYIL